MVALLRPTLVLADGIRAGLATGEMQFSGGIVQWAAGTPRHGQVVAWLRETNLQPAPPSILARALGPLSKILYIGGAVASVLNLGATIAFGVNTSRRLEQLESTVKDGTRQLKAHVDALSWTLDHGLRNMATEVDKLRQQLQSIADDQELTRWTCLQDASRIAWNAQAFQPGSSKRGQLLQIAYGQASPIAAYKLDRAELCAKLLCELLVSHRGSPSRLRAITKEHVASVQALRQASLASALRAAIEADFMSPGIAAQTVAADAKRLSAIVMAVGRAFVRGSNVDEPAHCFVYDDLLQACHRDAFPFERVMRLAARFDPIIRDPAALFTALRESPTIAPIHPITCANRTWVDISRAASQFASTTLSLLDERVAQHPAVAEAAHAFAAFPTYAGPCGWRHGESTMGENAPVVYAFVDALDGASEDVARLLGHAAEYAEAERLGLTLESYRSTLAIPDELLVEVGDSGIVFFSPLEASNTAI